MEDFKSTDGKERDIIFSTSVKAGKRIYYIDVKKNRKDELFLALTESKKIVSGDADSPSVNFEKHKIFLYQEDIEHFMTGMNEAIAFIRDHAGQAEAREEDNTGEIKIDIEF